MAGLALTLFALQLPLSAQGQSPARGETLVLKQRTTIFSQPGFQFSNWEKAKEQGADLQRLAWPEAGDEVEFLGAVRVGSHSSQRLPGTYYRVRYRGGNTPPGGVEGFLVADLVQSKGSSGSSSRNRTEAEDCSACHSGLQNQVQRIGQVIESGAKSSGARNSGPKPALVKINQRGGFNSACRRFIDGNGEPGAYGQVVLQAIRQIAPDCFFQQMEVGDLCPPYANFNQEQKEHFWLWVMASLAQDESSCNSRVTAAATNGQAVGLFQLEQSVALRRASARDPQLCRTSGRTETTQIGFQAECAVSIFRDHHCKPSANRLVYRGSYWQQLRRPSGGRVGALIRLNPMCGG